MDVKYTFRDIVVYLLTGFIVITILVFHFPDFFYHMPDIFHPHNKTCLHGVCSYLKAHETMILILSIPILYMIGHIIQVLDLTFTFYIAQFFKKFKPTQILYRIAGSTTVEYQRNKQGITEMEFIRQEYIVKINDRYRVVEYYYLLKELFNGLRTFVICLLLICIFIIPQVSISWNLTLLDTGLLILFWIRSRNAAVNYVWGIRNTYDALQNQPIPKSPSV